MNSSNHSSHRSSSTRRFRKGEVEIRKHDRNPLPGHIIDQDSKQPKTQLTWHQKIQQMKKKKAQKSYDQPVIIATQEEAELRVHLLAELPEYMIPNHYIFLDAFPLNANGKIDRKKLPTPDALVTHTKIPQ